MNEIVFLYNGKHTCLSSCQFLSAAVSLAVISQVKRSEFYYLSGCVKPLAYSYVKQSQSDVIAGKQQKSTFSFYLNNVHPDN